jgi:hypothetical protein
MMKQARSIVTGGASVLLSLFGCTNFHQGVDEVLVRDPSIGHYGEPMPAAKQARRQWEFAALSENAYQEGRASVRAKGTELGRSLIYRTEVSQAAFESACKDESLALPSTGWNRWDFPSTKLQQRMLKEGMYVEVLEQSINPRTIAVVFEGTNFTELPDWKANLRWFLRFIPGYQDQYIIASKYLAEEFYDIIMSPTGPYRINPLTRQLETTQGDPIKIVATGHSLGGGLAQHFAYTFKQPANEPYGPKIDEVFAFDPSPVTGWFSAKSPPRDYNATGLRIHRIFEHGEILAYIRLLTSRIAVTQENPAIWEYRYNFDSHFGMVGNHSMRHLACGLIGSAKPWLLRNTNGK